VAPAKLPPVRIPHPHVVLDETIADGSPVVEGTRVPVRRLFGWHRQGTTVETLLRRYPQLGPARILDALAFAYDNLDLMTADLLREREALARETSPGEEPHPQSPKERAAEAQRAQATLPFTRPRGGNQ
jgi:uncharacterized protein (DUF433 family)